MMHLLIVAIAGIGSMSLAFGQTPLPQLQAPNMPLPKDVPAEKMAPEEPSATGSTGTLSDRLEKSDGVIRPPETGTPDMTVPAPVPNPGTTPVIPPPGSPGGNPNVDPK